MTLYLRNLRKKGSGDYIQGRAGQALGVRKLVYRTAAGNWQLADADALTSMPVVGITMGPVNAGQIAEILIEGFIGWGPWTWTRGDTLYASQVAGEITNTAPGAPAIAQSIGVAITPKIIYFDGMPSGRGAELGNGPVDFTYLVERTDGNYTVYDDQGNIVHGPGADADTEINWALTTGGAGCVIALKENNTFAINNSIAFTANSQVLRGGGRSTFIDGDTLTTGNHAINLTGFDDCEIKDLSIQTEDGGGKICCPIFIEDGADRFQVRNIWIVNSDSSGIRIEGTTINEGWIEDCRIMDADAVGIYVNMDAGNFMYRLHIIGNDVAPSGGTGIFGETCGGNFYWVIEENIVHGCANYGIQLRDGDHSTITDNIVYDCGWIGIYVIESSHVTINDNHSYHNVQHGMYLHDADDCTVEGNQCIENDSGDTASYDGIYINADSDDNLITGNRCDDNDRYGIYNLGTRNEFAKNILRGNTTGPFNDSGADTILETLVFDFTHHGGGSAGWTDPVIITSPGGIDIDSDNEFAYCHVTLPNEVQEVIRITIWAYSNTAWAATNVLNMLLRIVVAGGTTTEAWNVEFIDVPNHPSEEDGSQGIAVFDVIHWIIDVGDDADLGDLADRDYLQVMAVGEAAVAPDLATDALFGGVEIEYV